MPIATYTISEEYLNKMHKMHKIIIDAGKYYAAQKVQRQNSIDIKIILNKNNEICR